MRSALTDSFWTSELTSLSCKQQWAVLIKKHAEVVVGHEVVLLESEKHCWRRPSQEFWRDWDRPFLAEAWKAHNCFRMSIMFRHCLPKLA
nr:unnamed protein product [Digitaria exilis]